MLDSCALGNLGVEYEAASKILELANEEQVSVITTYGVIDEISHPSTPQHVKNIAARLVFTISTERTPEEELRLQSIHTEMTGDSKPEKYAADANHIFEAGKYGRYFVTNDERILKKRQELNQLSGVLIVRPSEWIEAYLDNAPNFENRLTQTFNLIVGPHTKT